MARQPLPRDTRNPLNEYHAVGFIEAFLEDGVPVLVTSWGHYPDAALPDGTSTRDQPHIAIGIGGGTFSGRRYFRHYTVEAVGTQGPDGRRRTIKVAEVSTDETPEPWPLVEAAKLRLPEAMRALAGLDATWTAAEERMAALRPYYGRGGLDRAEYEAACRACGVEALPDEQCSTWGEFNYPQYSADDVVKLGLSQARGYRRERDAREAAEARARERAKLPKKAPRKEGQIWQECEHCGREPVYLPLFLCDRCWPTDEEGR